MIPFRLLIFGIVTIYARIVEEMPALWRNYTAQDL
jgi:hypothetical protein